MDVLYPRCAGLDVHKDSVVACISIASGGGVVTEVQTFDTTTASLVSLSEWLASNGCTHVAMEATGVYWKPVWHILSDSAFTLVLANAAHVKKVPGDRHQRRDLASRSPGPWSDPSELRTAIRVDCGHHASLRKIYMGGIGSAPCLAMASDDISYFQLGPKHTLAHPHSRAGIASLVDQTVLR